MPVTNQLRAITNSDLWDSIRAYFPSFASHTSKATNEMFTERGFEAMKATDPDTLNDFFKLSIRVWLQLVNTSRAIDPLDEADMGEYYDNPYGGFIQRMSINSVKPISPAYKGLSDGDSPDPFVVRKPSVAERFFVQNFDYASLITMPDEFQRKQIFVSEFGMSEFMAGTMLALQNGYTIQKYENKLAALNAAINSTTYPLQNTQVATVTFADYSAPTQAELQDFVMLVKKLVTAVTMGPQTSAFNAMKFADVQSKDRLRMLVRPGLMEAISTILTPWAYHDSDLAIPVPTVTVTDFGGLVPYKEAAHTTQLYPVYDSLGTMIGYTSTSGGSSVEVNLGSEFNKDPNSDVIAVLADKGLIFESRQNGYTVEPMRNPRGLYTNYWASSPNNTVAVDPLYTMIVIKKSAT